MTKLVKPLAGTLKWMGAEIRVVAVKPKQMLVAKDVAEALGYRDAAEMLKLVDEEMKGTEFLSTLGGPQQAATITREGLIQATLSSRRPGAKEFRRWALEQLDNILQNQPVEAPSGLVVQTPVHLSYQKYQDRLSLNRTPPGFWSIFRELADTIMELCRLGLPVDEHTMPDISVGQGWGKKWSALDGDRVFGLRQRMQHFFPAYFAQSKADVRPWIYPDASLPAFRAWLYGEYIPEMFPRYLQRKVDQQVITYRDMDRLAAAVLPKVLK